MTGFVGELYKDKEASIWTLTSSLMVTVCLKRFLILAARNSDMSYCTRSLKEVGIPLRNDNR